MNWNESLSNQSDSAGDIYSLEYSSIYIRICLIIIGPHGKIKHIEMSQLILIKDKKKKNIKIVLEIYEGREEACLTHFFMDSNNNYIVIFKVTCKR